MFGVLRIHLVQAQAQAQVQGKNLKPRTSNLEPSFTPL